MKKPFYKRWWFILFACLFILGIIGQLTEKKEYEIKMKAVELERKKEENKFINMSSSEHLLKAKRLLARGDMILPDEVLMMYAHLLAIPKNAIEWNEAKKMMKKIEIEKRKNAVKTIENSLLEQGMDVHISVEGEDCTTIRMQWILMSRPLVYKLLNDPLKDGTYFTEIFKKVGFRTIIFSDGYDKSWSVDLTKQEKEK